MAQLAKPTASNSQQTQHVIAGLNGGWSVFRFGASRVSRTFATRSEAIRYAREKAKLHGSEMVIHRRDGIVIDKPVRRSKQ